MSSIVKCLDEPIEPIASNRDVYHLSETDASHLNLDGDYLIKLEDPVGESDTFFHQNRREVRSYIESQERGQDFLPPVMYASSDFSWIIVREVHKIDTEYTDPWGRKSVEDFANNGFNSLEGVIPEEWNDNDGQTEYGFFGGNVVVIDGGQLTLEDEWIVGDPLESSLTKHRNEDMGEYIEISA